MSRDIIVKVTTRHYKAATSYSSNENCPLAIAAKMKFPKENDICAGSSTIGIGRGEYEINDWSENNTDEKNYFEQLVNSRIAKAKEGKKVPTTLVTLKFLYERTHNRI